MVIKLILGGEFMNTIYLISCSKLKKNIPCSAEEMYEPSSLFKASLNYALKHVNNKNEQIYILSAKYHILSLSEVICPYDITLNKMSKIDREKWAQSVYCKMIKKFDMKNTHFIFLAGQNYIKPLIPYLGSNQYSNPVPEECRSIGKRIKWLKESNLRISNEMFAKDLRNLEQLGKIPKNMPGWYRWWAPKEALKMLLDSKYLSHRYLSELLPYLTEKVINGQQYYYIYTGIAVKESINRRIDWHINQRHTQSSVSSGFLSTLRQSIASLVSGNQYDEIATNNLINMLVVEYHPVNLPLNSEEAKVRIENIEETELTINVIPLNIMNNKKDVLKNFICELRNIRKKSK